MPPLTIPKGLSPEARRLWRETSSTYVVEDAHHRELLELACRSLDRMLEARRLLAADGLVSVDRFGQRKPHPAISIEKGAAETFMRALKELGLDAPEPGRPGRPSGR